MTIKGENVRDILRTVIGSTNVISTFPASYHQALPASKETSKMLTAHTSAAAGSSATLRGAPTHQCPAQWVCPAILPLQAPSAQGALNSRQDKSLQDSHLPTWLHASQGEALADLTALPTLSCRRGSGICQFFCLKCPSTPSSTNPRTFTHQPEPRALLPPSPRQLFLDEHPSHLPGSLWLPNHLSETEKHTSSHLSIHHLQRCLSYWVGRFPGWMAGTPHLHR